MNDITAFLSARIDEEDAQWADPHDWWHNNPRWKAELEAKRTLVELHEQQRTPKGNPLPCLGCGRFESPCPTLRVLASVYADHPDYIKRWL